MRSQRVSGSRNKTSQLRALLSYYAVPVVLTYGLINGRFAITGGLRYFYLSYLSPEVGRIGCYLILGLWLSHFVCTVPVSRGKPRFASCTTLLAVAGCVYVVQVIGYLAFCPFHPALLFPLAIPICLLLVVSPRMIRQRFKSTTRAVSGHPAQFKLDSGKPDAASKEKRCSFAEMMDELSVALKKHDGRFVITDRQWSGDSKSAQYRYYAPEDLAYDSYPESDIEAAKRLIGVAFDGLPDDIKAVKIPGDAIKDIGKFDDDPMFTMPPDRIPTTPMNGDELIAFLRSTLSDFDRDGCQFGMNEPYSSEGIYLWHNYI